VASIRKGFCGAARLRIEKSGGYFLNINEIVRFHATDPVAAALANMQMDAEADKKDHLWMGIARGLTGLASGHLCP